MAPASGEELAHCFPAWTCPQTLHTSHFFCQDQPVTPVAAAAASLRLLSAPWPLLPGSAVLTISSAPTSVGSQVQ